ncbi:MAG: LLM class flavin-dependent oxidoreductase [Nitrososphaerales archaeon]
MSQLKFGVQFRNFPSQFGGDIMQRIVAVAKKCEDLAFDSVWMVDHLEMRPPIAYESQPIPDCWTTISALASSTNRIGIGSLVTCTLFRNPKYLVKVCETINKISKGRLIVGLGSGWFEKEFQSYGIEYPRAAIRISSCKQAAKLLKNKVPVWIGGSGEKSTLKMVAEYADGCSLFGDPQTVAHKLKVIQNYCQDRGSNYDALTKSKHSNVVIAETKDLVEQKLRNIIPDENKWNDFSKSNIVGTPDECREQVKQYIAAGIGYFTLSFPDLFELNCLDLFSNSVIGLAERPLSV